MSTETNTTDTPGTEPESAETGDAGVDATETPSADSVVDEDQGADEDQDADAGDGPGREAAKYRRRLRDAEAERDTLAARVEALQRAEAERQATAGGLKPAALWASGTELAGLLGDDGTVDESKVSAAIAVARESLGIPRPAYNTKEGRVMRRPSGKPSGREQMVATVMGRNDTGDD